MNWTYNGIRIFVVNRTGEGKQIMPMLQPLSGGTVVQFYGYESEITQIGGLVVGATDLRNLMNLKKTATPYTLTSPEGEIGALYLKNIKYNRLPSIYQTMRLDLPCESPVYDVDLDLVPSGNLLL